MNHPIAKTILTIVTLSCFMVSSIFSQGYPSFVNEKIDSRRFESILNKFVLSPSIGRITDGKYAGSGKVVVTIQDLHCHPEVQKNISSIIEELDRRFKVKTVFQEGAVSEVDTSWLGESSSEDFSRQMMDSLLKSGMLTGAEYYSGSSKKYGLIKGLENKELYKSNVLRLNEIIRKRPEINRLLEDLRNDIYGLEKKYYGRKNLKLKKTIENYNKENISHKKYYSLLEKYAVECGIDFYSYENLNNFIKLGRLEKQINIGRVSAQLNSFLSELKNILPYSSYQSFLAKTRNFKKAHEIFFFLEELKKYGGKQYDFNGRFPDLFLYSRYITENQKLNPLELVLEEKKLLRQLRISYSITESEREIVFIADFAKTLKDYINNEISSDEQGYFDKEYDKFRLLVLKYCDDDLISNVEKHLQVVKEFYKANIERDRYFIKNIFKDIALSDKKNVNLEFIKSEDINKGDIEQVVSSLGKSSELIVTVMGGFHTRGFTELLKQNGISYLVITPNVSKDTLFSENVYIGLMELQGKILSESLAVALLSQDPPDLKFIKTLTAFISGELVKGSGLKDINSELNEGLKYWQKTYGKRTFELIKADKPEQDVCGYFEFKVTGEDGVISHYAVENNQITVLSDADPLIDALNIMKPDFIEDKILHIYNVINVMKAFVKKDFEYIYKTFDDNDEFVDKDEYLKLLNKMYEVYDSLTSWDKEVLRVATIFHDIGAIKKDKIWGHNRTGAVKVKSVLDSLIKTGKYDCNDPERFIDDVSWLIYHHGDYFNLGVDVLPNDLMDLPESRKNLITLIMLFDGSANRLGNILYPWKISLLLDLKNESVKKYSHDVDAFLRFRFGNLFCPPIVTDKEQSKEHQGVVMDLLKEKSMLTSEFKNNWHKSVRIDTFGLFQDMGQRSLNEFVELIYSLNKVIQDNKDENINDIIIDTDIDILEMPYDQRYVYRDRIINILRNKQNLPLKIIRENNTLKIIIVLEDTLKPGLSSTSFVLKYVKGLIEAIQKRISGEVFEFTGAAVNPFYKGIELVSETMPEISSSKPVVAVFDLHGTLLKPTWKGEYAMAFSRLTGNENKVEALKWVNDNTISRTEKEVAQLLAAASGKSLMESEKALLDAHKYVRDTMIPEAIPGALDFIKELHRKKVPIVVTSGSLHSVAIEHLKYRGFLDYIPYEMVIGKDDVLLSRSESDYNKAHYREMMIEGLKYHFPLHTIAFFNDSGEGFKKTKEVEGINFALPQGEGKEKHDNIVERTKEGADFVLDGFDNYRGIIELLKVTEKTQKTEKLAHVSEEKAVEVPVVIPAPRSGGLTLHIEVSDDLERLTYSEVVDDKNVFNHNGIPDYLNLKLKKIIEFPSSHLISPQRYMDKHFRGRGAAGKLYREIWPQFKRYTSYRRITVSSDQKIDKDVWTTNIDTVYLHKIIEDSGILNNSGIKIAIEIGTGGGHIAAFLASRIPDLEELIITDISFYALRAAKRNIMAYLKNEKGQRTVLRSYFGKGLGTIEGAKADLIVINPPYIPVSPFETRTETDPYRGTGLIKEVLEKGIYKLNPNNPNASIIMNVSSLALDDFEEYARNLGEKLIIEKMGDSLKVPLKIKTITQEWKDWLVEKGLLEYREDHADDEEPYWHTLQVYKIRPKPGIVRTDPKIEKDKIESEIYSNTESLIRTFQPILSMKGDPNKEEKIKKTFPVIQGYLSQPADEMNYDSEPAALSPERNLSLSQHIIERGFGRKLLGLEKNDINLFQDKGGLSSEEFNDIRKIVDSMDKIGIMPYLRCAFLHHDASKSYPQGLRKKWEKIKGIDFRIPGKASGMILRNLESDSSWEKGLFENIALIDGMSEKELLNELFYRVIETRGLFGQWARGEVTYDVFKDFTGWVRGNLEGLTSALGCETNMQEGSKKIAEIVYLFNFLDTASLREGLMTSRLNGQFLEIINDFQSVITPRKGKYVIDWNDIRLKKWNSFDSIDSKKAYLKNRFARFRQERKDDGESGSEIENVIESINSDKAVEILFNGMQHFQGWYVESATFGLSAESAVKLVALALALANRKNVDISKPFHINYFGLMKELSAGRHEYDKYKARMIETILRDLDIEEIMLKPETAARFDMENLSAGQSPVLGAAGIEVVDGQQSIPFNFIFSEEAENLLKLINIYELSDEVKYHTTLKMLLDVYGIRKDDFDRVANEMSYMETMESSKDDKSRLLSHGVGGRGSVWVEVGPGDGKTLMTEIAGRVKKEKGIERVIGIEASREAFERFQQTIIENNLPVEAILGDATKIEEIMLDKGIDAPSTIIFCSMLHEVFSYVEKNGKKFNLESVKSLLRSSLLALASGGRILVRDGVIPENGDDIQTLEIIGKNNKEVFDSFVLNFQGRELSYVEVVESDLKNEVWKVKIKRKDAMEFLFKLTWCYKPEFDPSSFPYEVREQYGVLTREGYIDLFNEIAKEVGVSVREVEIPEEEKSYLQEGYVKHLKGHARLLDENGEETRLPDSNMMIVIEKMSESVLQNKAGKGLQKTDNYTYSQWHDLCESIGAKGDINGIFKEVKEKYDQEGRHHHNLSHIEYLLKGLEKVSDLAEDIDALRFAIFMHDTFYDNARYDNEEKSAEYAVNVCKRLGLSGQFSEKVRKLIMVTKDHIPEDDDMDAKIFVDLDFAILAGAGNESVTFFLGSDIAAMEKSKLVFETYDLGINKEFSSIPRGLFIKGRLEILRKFLEREHIYNLAIFREKYETRARENLESAISLLEKEKAISGELIIPDGAEFSILKYLGKKVAVYPGYFDKFTELDIDIINKAKNNFDEVVVLVIPRNGKNDYEKIKETCSRIHLKIKGQENVTVAGLRENNNGDTVVDFMKVISAKMLVRKLRNITDRSEQQLDAESLKAENNFRKYGLETIFIIPSQVFLNISAEFLQPTIEAFKGIFKAVAGGKYEWSKFYSYMDVFNLERNKGRKYPVLDKKKAFYAGSFDPITNGHMEVIARASEIYEKVYVGVGVNPTKLNGYMFNTDEKVRMIRDAVKSYGLKNVEVVPYEGYTVDAAASVGAGTLIRGARGVKDLKDELPLSWANSLLSPEIDTAMLVPYEYKNVSSSYFKEELKAGRDISGIVPGSVYWEIMKREYSEIKKDTKLIGLIGGIGSGKSTVLKELGKNEKTLVIDLDKINHEFQESQPVIEKIAKEFGDKVMMADKRAIDRQALRNEAFSSRINMYRLTRIMHSLIFREMDRLIREAFNKGCRQIVIEGIGIVDSGVDKVLDELWFVDAPEETRIERTVARKSPGLSVDDARLIVDAQKENLEKVKRKATHIIDNSGSITELNKKYDENQESLQKKKDENGFRMTALGYGLEHLREVVSKSLAEFLEKPSITLGRTFLHKWIGFGAPVEFEGVIKESIEKLVFANQKELSGFGKNSVETRIVTIYEDKLVDNDKGLCLLATMGMDSRKNYLKQDIDEIIFSVHHRLWEILLNNTDPYSVNNYIELIVNHEFYEFMALNVEGSRIQAGFKYYLLLNTTGKNGYGTNIKSHMTAENFHKYIEYLSRKAEKDMNRSEKFIAKKINPAELMYLAPLLNIDFNKLDDKIILKKIFAEESGTNAERMENVFAAEINADKMVEGLFKLYAGSKGDTAEKKEKVIVVRAGPGNEVSIVVKPGNELINDELDVLSKMLKNELIGKSKRGVVNRYVLKVNSVFFEGIRQNDLDDIAARELCQLLVYYEVSKFYALTKRDSDIYKHFSGFLAEKNMERNEISFNAYINYLSAVPDESNAGMNIKKAQNIKKLKKILSFNRKVLMNSAEGRLWASDAAKHELTEKAKALNTARIKDIIGVFSVVTLLAYLSSSILEWASTMGGELILAVNSFDNYELFPTVNNYMVAHADMIMVSNLYSSKYPIQLWKNKDHHGKIFKIAKKLQKEASEESDSAKARKLYILSVQHYYAIPKNSALFNSSQKAIYEINGIVNKESIIKVRKKLGNMVFDMLNYILINGARSKEETIRDLEISKGAYKNGCTQLLEMGVVQYVKMRKISANAKAWQLFFEEELKWEDYISREMFFGFGTGDLSNSETMIFNPLLKIFTDSGMSKDEAIKIAFRLAKIKREALKLLEVFGVISGIEKELLVREIFKSTELIIKKPLNLTFEEKDSLALKFQGLIDSYESGLAEKEKNILRENLLPKSVIEFLMERYGINRSQSFEIIEKKQDFPAWINKANQKVVVIEERVGSIKNAWDILLQAGDIEKVDKYIEIISQDVFKMNAKGMNLETAWKMAINNQKLKSSGMIADESEKGTDFMSLYGSAKKIPVQIDPRRLLTGEISAKAAVKIFPDGKKWLMGKAPELIGKTIIHFYSNHEEINIDELSEISDAGTNNICILPYVPAEGFKEAGKIIVKRNKKDEILTVMSGKIYSEEAGAAGVLVIEGLEANDIAAVVSWLKETPAIHREIAAELGLYYKDIAPSLIELNAGSRKVVSPVGGYLPTVLNMLGGLPVILRVDGVLPENTDMKDFDVTVNMKRFEGMTAQSISREMITGIYQPALLRRASESVAMPGANYGEIIPPSVLRSVDYREDSGIGELGDLVEYAAKLKKEGREIVQLTPITLPIENSPFEAADSRAGDFALIKLTDVEEVKILLKESAGKENKISRRELFASENQKIAVDRASVKERKFLVLDKARKLFYGNGEKARFGEYEKYLDLSSNEWINSYAKRMAAAKIINVLPTDVKEEDIENISINGGTLFEGYKETFKYMQWLFSLQAHVAFEGIHDAGAKVYFWKAVSDENFEASLREFDYWFGLGFDGVRIDIKDEESTDLEKMSLIRNAISRCKPGASVLVSLPETISDEQGEFLCEQLNVRRVMKFSEIEKGRRFSQNIVVETDSIDSEERTHSGSEDDLSDFYMQRMAKVRGAGGIFSVVGNMWGDDWTVKIGKPGNGHLWDYRVPLEGEVSFERVKRALEGFAREMLIFSNTDRRYAYQNGYTIGLEMFKDAEVSDQELRILKKYMNDELDGSDIRVSGYGLHSLSGIYGRIKNLVKTGKSVPTNYIFKGIEISKSIMLELADVESSNSKYWKAALIHIEYLENRFANEKETQTKLKYGLELFGFVRGIMEAVSENNYLKNNLSLVGESDKAVKRALIGTMDSFVVTPNESIETAENYAMPGASREKIFANSIRVLLSTGKIDEAGKKFDGYFREKIDPGDFVMSIKGMERFRYSLELIELMNMYCLKYDDTKLIRSKLPYVRKILRSFSVIAGSDVLSKKYMSVKLEALFYNALMIMAGFENPDLSQEWIKLAQVTKNSITEISMDLLKEGEESINLDMIYLISLSGSGYTFKNGEELLSQETKNVIMNRTEKYLLSINYLKETPSDIWNDMEYIGAYVDALTKLQNKGAFVLHRKTENDVRRLINPLLEELLIDGMVERFISFGTGNEYSEVLAIAELYRIFDMVVKQEIPEFADPEKAFKGAVDAINFKSVKFMKGAA